jgi:RNA polymerase sigma-70 factor, ECF subfamily
MSPLESASDALLATRAAEGDEGAFRVLVRRHAPYLRAFATRMLSSSADADDVVQESLIVAWRSLDSLSDRSKVRSWMSSIVARKATDVLRARRPVAELDESRPAIDSSPDEAAEQSSRLRALGEVLRTLPDEQRQCWVLREISGFSYDEIADQLGISTTVVRGKLARARATVMQEMEGWR